MATEFVQKLPLWVEGEQTFFDESNTRYEVPIYQRAFAWGTKSQDVDRPNEIDQLMDDIAGIIPEGAADGDKIAPYFLGSMVVKKSFEEKTGCRVYEVIDGQQRLTALYILFSCLGIPIKNELALTYKCRARSENAIKYIENIISHVKGNMSGVSNEEGPWKYKTEKVDLELEGSICDGVRTILLRLNDKKFEDRLRRGLKYVNLYRIEVPENTDLNRYFEVMNTRGEQLEPQDIIKGRIVSYLAPCHREIFSKIWNACSDMNGYVQMHLGKETREQWFGKEWNELPDLESKEKDGDENKVNSEITIWKAVLAKSNSLSTNVDDDDDEMEKPYDKPRFRSVIDFPHFLLNVIKVFKCHKIGQAKTDVEGWELSEKNLIPKFLELFPKGLTDDEQEKRAWQFAQFLLECRYLFDKYIVKRDYARDEALGEWSLKELKENDSTPEYTQTGTATADSSRKELLMLQSCLRVTYTDFKGMHWITRLLDWLYVSHENGIVSFADFVKVAEKIACEAAKSGVDKLRGANCRLGTLTPHIIFNYLDFLLWKNAHGGKRFLDQGGNLKPFVFAYRNSVEHWYPQHPENLEAWEDRDEEKRRAVDQFGNLCIVQPSENSKFSNLRPKAKKDQYMEDVISKGSLKLRLMAEKTIDANEVQWKKACVEHGGEMLNLLDSAFRRVLGVNPNNDHA